MAIDKNKILATESTVNSIVLSSLDDFNTTISTTIESNDMALTPGALGWNGVFDGLYYASIGQEDDIEYGYVRVTEEVPDDFSIEVSLLMGVPTFFGIASALESSIYTSIASMPVEMEEGVYAYFRDGEEDTPLAIINKSPGMPQGVYFLYASIMGKAVMSVASMRLPSYAFNSNSVLTDTKTTISIPNQSAYFWDGNIASADYKGSLFLGDTELPLYLKYAGECDLTYEELQSKNIIGLYQDGTNAIISVDEDTGDNGVKYTALSPMSFFSLTGAFIFYEHTEVSMTDGTQTIEWSIDQPGLYFVHYAYPSIIPLTFIEIENSVHIGELTYPKSIKPSYLPEHLQFGDISYPIQKSESSTTSLGSTLYWTDNNAISTGDMTRECRVADFKEIPENTVITGVHKNTGEILNLVNVDGKIWAVDDVPAENVTAFSGWYAIIRPSGIYLCNFGGGGYDSWLSSITFQDMTFTYTTYNVVSDEVQVFKTLDEKYLPDTIATKAYVDAAIATMKSEILTQIAEGSW